MKVKKEIVETLLKNLNENKSTYEEIFDFAISKISVATEVESIMQRKQELLKNLVRALPTSARTCYFCILYDDSSCADCEYGKIHKPCSDKDSDNTKIIVKKSALKAEISNYYIGEKYIIESIPPKPLFSKDEVVVVKFNQDNELFYKVKIQEVIIQNSEIFYMLILLYNGNIISVSEKDITKINIEGL